MSSLRRPLAAAWLLPASEVVARRNRRDRVDALIAPVLAALAP